MDWVDFSIEQPEENNLYDVCVVSKGGNYVETAHYSKSRNIFYFYSRRGYIYEIPVTHWRKLPDLPTFLGEENGNSNIDNG